MDWAFTQEAYFFDVFLTLVERYDKCLNETENYVEK